MQQPLHTFHIPVMGLAFTMDSPIKVAHFGISSVMSIVEDRLVEMMRKHYYEKLNEKYVPISTYVNDYRAKRITDYLNLVNRIVSDQLEKLKTSAFKAGNDAVLTGRAILADHAGATDRFTGQIVFEHLLRITQPFFGVFASFTGDWFVWHFMLR